MRKPRGMACKRSVAFIKPFQVKDPEDYFGVFAILFSAQVFPTFYQLMSKLIKIWQPRVRGPDDDPEFFENPSGAPSSV